MIINTKLDLLVESAYTKFSSYSFGNIVAVHHGICCLSDKDVQLLKILPIHELSPSLIYSYLDAGEENDSLALVKQIKYLLPRILELLVEDQYIHHSNECVFDKLKLNLEDAWKVSEIEFIQYFALSFFKSKLNIFDHMNDISSYIVMFHRGGLDIQPLLDQWVSLIDSTIPFMNLIKIIYEEFKQNCFNNPFADHECITLMNNWLLNLKNNECFIDSIITNLVSDSQYSQYRYMINDVFDGL